MTLYDEKCPLMSDDVFKCQSMSTNVKAKKNSAKLIKCLQKWKKKWHRMTKNVQKCQTMSTKVKLTSTFSEINQMSLNV